MPVSAAPLCMRTVLQGGVKALLRRTLHLGLSPAAELRYMAHLSAQFLSSTAVCFFSCLSFGRKETQKILAAEKLKSCFVTLLDQPKLLQTG